MRPLVGWGLGGPCVRPRAASASFECATLGEPAWSPAQLLRDLHLRLGMPQDEASPAERVPAYAKRLAALVATRPFYAKSYAVDPLGTAKALLAWRDGLVDAGWNGQPAGIQGGDRLEALARVEAIDDEPLPVGSVDRLRRVENELLVSSKHRIYDAVTLVEPRALWSARWRSIFALLEARGATFAQLSVAYARAPEGSDLGVLQRMLRGELPSRRAREGSAVAGDGTLLLLRGDTTADLAELTAALLVKHRQDAVVVRCAEAAVLETALERHGLPHHGHAGASAWRPAMQLLPLALELAYEPRDPHRVLELLTLPVGPFRGMLGASLARAVARQPGVGGAEWERQRAKAAERLRARRVTRRASEGMSEIEAALDGERHVAERMRRVAEWIEAPCIGAGGAEGAPRLGLLAVAARVRAFLKQRLAVPDSGEIYGAAFSQASAMVEALMRDERDVVSREAMRQLLDGVVRGEERVDLTIERAGRIPHVDHPDALFDSAAAVVFWGFIAGAERRPKPPPWNAGERAALAAVGVAFPDPGELLAAESEAWRRGILAARERVIFVVPEAVKGEATALHPTWDEIAARLGLDDDRAIARLTRWAHVLVARGDASLVPLTTLSPLALPESHASWTLPAARFGAARGDEEEAIETSTTALDALASCPLRFVLSQHARLQAGALAKVSSGPLLNGSLGHRLVEELHREGAFELEADELVIRASAVLEALLVTEGATLLLAGAAFERSQLVPQLVNAMRELQRYLVTTGWKIAGVEEAVTTSSTVGTLRGRIDLRLVNARGEQAVLDLKWGESSYRALLEEGRAVQLAAYVRAIHVKGAGRAIPPAAYFALQSGKVLTADARMGMGSRTLEGPTLEETWARIEKTARAVQASMRQGKVHVAATKRALPLLTALGVAKPDEASHYALAKPEDACKYCEYPAICGTAWEAVR